MHERDTRRWDFFLAHAGADTAMAEALYDVLIERATVFLDERSMLPGDSWTRILPAVLKQSRIIVVLVSAHTRGAWYQDSEIRIALDLLRDYPERYRVIALLLDEAGAIRRSELPYGLEQTVLVSWAKCGGVVSVAKRLLETLEADHGQRQDIAAATMSLPVDGITGFVGEAERGPTWPILLTSWEDFTRNFGEPLGPERTYLPAAVRGFFENGGERAYVARVIASGAARATLSIATGHVEQQLVLTARSAGAHGNTIRVRTRRGSRIGVRLSIGEYRETSADLRDGSPSSIDCAMSEAYDNLSPGTSGPNPLLQRVNGGSQLISAEWAQRDREGAAPEIGEWTLGGGADGRASVPDYLGDPNAPLHECTGLASLVRLQDIGIVCMPDATHPRFTLAEQRALTDATVAHCERERCFAVLAAGADQDEQPVVEAPADSSSAAIYFPWVTVPHVSATTAILVPPVGHVAGAYARHDRAHGVHASPAGLELAGLVASANRDIDCTRAARSAEDLMQRGVNALCREASTGRVFVASAVTMAIDESWRRIGVRRFLNFVGRSFRAGTEWVAFAPNNEATWTQVREEIETFLTKLWRAGILRGETREEAFFVRCDRSTTSDVDIANGRVNWVMGVALADPDLKFPLHATAHVLEHRAEPPPEVGHA
jgi:hypothetical protein